MRLLLVLVLLAAPLASAPTAVALDPKCAAGHCAQADSEWYGTCDEKRGDAYEGTYLVANGSNAALGDARLSARSACWHTEERNTSVSVASVWVSNAGGPAGDAHTYVSWYEIQSDEGTYRVVYADLETEPYRMWPKQVRAPVGPPYVPPLLP